MAHRDDPKDELAAAGTQDGGISPSSSPAVRGPTASGGAVDRAHAPSSGKPGDSGRGARPKVAPPPARQGDPPPGRPTEELPETYGIDEVEILCKDPWWYFAYWEVTEAGFAAAREQLGPSAADARLVLRVFTSGPAGGPGSRSRDGREIRDVPVTVRHGRRYLEAPRSNALLRVAVGLLSREGYFAPIAHSSVVRVPPQQPSSDTAVEWLHVLPPRGDGRQHERIVKGGPRPTHQERALPWQMAGSAAAEERLVVPAPTTGARSSSSSPGAVPERSPGEEH